jgi:putative transposase
MREMGLTSRISKAFTPTNTEADPTKSPAPNRLERDFTAQKPNEKWVTDITYLPTLAGWVYVAVLLDLFSRKVVGWSIRDSLSTPLVADALRQAVEARRPVGSELLHHSDHGSQYTSDAYQQTLRTLGIECSMSRTGDCYDNAVAERFFWSLKHEWTKHEEFADLEAARLSVFKYVETFYNSVRLHQALDYKSPNEFETEYTSVLAA